jgi:hypothetical protein
MSNPRRHPLALPTPASGRWYLNYLAILCWLSVAWLIIFVDPAIIADYPLAHSYGLFVGLITLAVALTGYQLTHKFKLTLFIILIFVFTLYLRINQIGLIYNLLVLIAPLIFFKLLHHFQKPRSPMVE